MQLDDSKIDPSAGTPEEQQGYLNAVESEVSKNADSFIEKDHKNALRKSFVLGLTCGLLLTFLTVIAAQRLREWAFAILPHNTIAVNEHSDQVTALRRETLNLERRVTGLKQRFTNLTPSVPYIIINTSDNRFTLKAGNKTLHEGFCSTGSYTILKAADNSEKWVFKTPRGMLRVHNKIVDPVWRMPDWAFIEEGMAVPAPYASERYERGVLGDYALDIGDGYLIHGTLYQRYLGMPVTHGCIRLGDKELEVVYKTLSLNSKVFIY